MPLTRVSPRLLIAVAVLALFSLLYSDAAADAQTFVVNTTAETSDGVCDPSPGGCTVADAIAAANANSGVDTIHFAPGLTSFTLTAALPALSAVEGVTIEGTDAPVTFTRAGVAAFDGLVVQSGVGLPLQHATVRKMNFVGFDGSGLVICGGTRDAQCVNGDIDSATVDHVASQGNTQFGVLVFGENVSSVAATNLDTENNTLDGLSMIAQGSDVELSFVSDTDHTSIHDRVGAAFASENHITFLDVLRANISQGTTGIAVHAQDPQFVTVHNSSIHDESFAGIGVENSPDFFEAEDNDIERTGSDGIILKGSPFGSEINRNQIRHAGAGGITIDSPEDDASNHLQANIIENASGDGIHLGGVDEVQNNVVETNVIDVSGGNGIFMSGQQFSDNIIRGNLITSSNTDGIRLQAGGSKPDAVVANQIVNNTVLFDGQIGINVSPDGVLTFPRVTISQNSTRGNSKLGIDLYAQTDSSSGVTPNDAGDTDAGVNSLLNFPVLTADSSQFVSGQACAFCAIELFTSDGDATGFGEGDQFINSVTADGGGFFSVPICGGSPGSLVTATATDGIGETSEFSANFTLTATSADCPTPTPEPTDSPTPSPTPTATPQSRVKGDLDCSGTVTARDALVELQFVASTTLITRAAGCPLPNEIVGDKQFGDVDCDGDVDSSDGVRILAFAAGVPKSQPGGCGEIGSPVG